MARDDVTIESNQAGSGGGAAVSGAFEGHDAVRIAGNEAASGGGLEVALAVCPTDPADWNTDADCVTLVSTPPPVVDPSVVLDGLASVENNVATNDGGGAKVSNPGTISAAGAARFLANLAGEDGGGVFTQGCPLTPTFTARDDVVLEGNVAVSGGAIASAASGNRPYCVGWSLQDDVLVRLNTASANGGAVAHVLGAHVAGAASDRVVFQQNHADGDGGALFMTFGSDVTLTDDVRVEGNTAGGNGGAVAMDGESLLTIIGTTFATDALVWPDWGAPSTGGVRLTGNSASVHGGAIHARSLVRSGLDEVARVEADGLLVLANKATQGDGGGIYIEDVLEVGELAGKKGSAFLTNTLVNGNTAIRGGAMWVVGREVTLDLVGSTTSASPCDPAEDDATPILPKDRYCAEVSGNAATGALTDAVGGIGVWDGGVVRVANGAITKNLGHETAPAAVLVGGAVALPGERQASFTLTNGHVFEQERGASSLRLVTGKIALASVTLAEHGLPLRVEGGSVTLNRSVAFDLDGGLLGTSITLVGGTLTGTENLGTQVTLADTTNLEVDPRFVETDRGRHRLDAGSPAIDQVFAPPTFVDIDTVLRVDEIPAGNVVDAGAFEHVP